MQGTQTDWLTTRIGAALSERPVGEAVALTIKIQLQGAMSQRALRSGELDFLALSLLDLVNKLPDGQATK